jgi:uncharacterized protein YhbP (UPF0306 family)
MPIRHSKRPLAAAHIARIARSLLDASSLCAIASVGPGARAHINIAYFAWSRALKIIWLSEPRSRHSRNLRANETVAIAVFDSRQRWAEPDRGIQLFGSAWPAEGDEAEQGRETYARRFPSFRDARLSGYRLYVFRPSRLKLFDERALGGGTFVTAVVSRTGRVKWERTEIYLPDE